jgi:hypothetical protein
MKCSACDVDMTEHLGMAGTCKALQEAKAEIIRLEEVTSNHCDVVTNGLLVAEKKLAIYEKLINDLKHYPKPTLAVFLNLIDKAHKAAKRIKHE